MPNSSGPFTISKFMGATVVNINISAGFNEQATNLTMTLVEDEIANDDFILKDENPQNIGGRLIGTPFAYTYESFSFSGLLIGYQQLESIDGKPTFQITLGSPLSLLENTQVILSNYVGPVNDSIKNGEETTATFSLRNAINVYGYLEDGGDNFGNSLLNDSGLLWEGTQGVKEALVTLTNQDVTSDATGDFGSYIKFRGHTYKLNLDGLPHASALYRIGGSVNASIMDIISRYCQEAGVDFLVFLILGSGTGPHTIAFKTVDRAIQPQLGLIESYATNSAAISTKEKGQELRNEITQALLIGGDIHLLYPMDNWSAFDPAVVPFWGFDINGIPIRGVKPNGTFYADDDHAMNLNASVISDITGALGFGITYPCTILEMRCALVDYDSWATYITINRTDIAETVDVGIQGAGSLADGSNTDPKIVHDFVNDRLVFAEQLSTMNDTSAENQWTTISQRLYEFVRESASTYYGRKFLVKVPFRVQLKIVPGDLTVTFSHETTDAGYLPEGSSPLGLNYLNTTYFSNDDGRFTPFMRYAAQSNFGAVSTLPDYKQVVVNPALLKNNDVVFQNNGYNSTVYLKCQEGEAGPLLQNGLLTGNSNIVIVYNAFGLPVPAVICSVSEPLFAQAQDALGGVDDIAYITGEDMTTAVNFKATSFPMKLHPPAFYPNGVAIAMRNNQFTYGPWGSYGVDGKVEFERDESLVPWEYGSFDSLNDAAQAKLVNIATKTQVIEKGTIVEAGTPDKNIGDVLIADGPVIAGISINIAAGGVTTTYNMETFIPQFGRFSRDNSERIRRLGKYNQQLKRAVRQLWLEGFQKANILLNSSRGFMYGASYAVKQQTPHAAIIAHLIGGSGNNGGLRFNPSVSGPRYAPIVYTGTLQESLGNLQVRNGGGSDFLKTAVMGFEGLLRPASTKIDDTYLSHYVTPNTSIATPVKVTNSNYLNLNPFKEACDIHWISQKDEYDGLNRRKSALDPTYARFIALRGPLEVSGYGYDIVGRPTPNASGDTGTWQSMGNTVASGYLNNSKAWPAGPVDLRWDKMRGVWASPGCIYWGKLDTTATANAGPFDLNLDNNYAYDLIDRLPVYNFFSTDIAAQTKVSAGYDPVTNKWRIISADC